MTKIMPAQIMKYRSVSMVSYLIANLFASLGAHRPIVICGATRAVSFIILSATIGVEKIAERYGGHDEPLARLRLSWERFKTV